MDEFIYEQADARHDLGGVHVNSGIPNKAFYLAATAFGGKSWEKAGQIWWKAIRSGRVTPTCTFQQFADITVDSAKEVGGDDAAKTVRQAWIDVAVRGNS
jgi:Zn-dependent metalloprotease